MAKLILFYGLEKDSKSNNEGFKVTVTVKTLSKVQIAVPSLFHRRVIIIKLLIYEPLSTDISRKRVAI